MQQYPSAPFAQVEALLSDLIDSYQQADTASSIMATSAAVRDSIREADGAETRLKGLISGTASETSCLPRAWRCSDRCGPHVYLQTAQTSSSGWPDLQRTCPAAKGSCSSSR